MVELQVIDLDTYEGWVTLSYSRKGDTLDLSEYEYERFKAFAEAQGLRRGDILLGRKIRVDWQWQPWWP